MAVAKAPPVSSLAGPDKAAIFVLGMEKAARDKVVGNLSEMDAEKLAKALASPPHISVDQRLAVVNEFRHTMAAHGYIRSGGLDRAREVLEGGIGREGAERIMARLAVGMRLRPFAALAQTSNDDLLTFLLSEHPQTAAVVLAYVPPVMAAYVLEHMDEALRVDVAERLARLESLRPEVLHLVEKSVSDRVSSTVTFDIPPPRGIDATVAILAQSDRTVERQVIAGIAEHDQELADEIKQRMFMFEDLLKLRPDVLEKILREVDKQDLAVALRTVGESERVPFFNAMSDRVATEIQELITDSPPRPLRDVEAAQGRVVAKARELDEAGEIELAGATSEEALV